MCALLRYQTILAHERKTAVVTPTLFSEKPVCSKNSAQTAVSLNTLKEKNLKNSHWNKHWGIPKNRIGVGLPKLYSASALRHQIVWMPIFLTGASGGICERYKEYTESSRNIHKSLNTGIVTLINYGSPVPPKVSILTFAHEVGHNMGSPVRVLSIRLKCQKITRQISPPPHGFACAIGQ